MSLSREAESTQDHDISLLSDTQNNQLVVRQQELDIVPRIALSKDWAGTFGRDGRKYVVRTNTPEPGKRPWRILSLDGGGVKGLAELRILERLFETIRNRKQRETGIEVPELPLPCDYFDLICGTSTGGLIAIMLGRLRMSIPEALENFQALARKIFPSGKSAGLTKLYKGLFGSAYFDGKHMEAAVQELLQNREGDSEGMLKETPAAACKVFVCATRAQTLKKVLLRSYRTTDSSEKDYAVKIWEAARATSAAPLFFDPFKIERLGLTVVDGALRLNNPVYEVVNEAHRIDEDRKIGCLVSIGTGVMDPEPLRKTNVKLHQVAKTCADISINCDNVAQDFAKTPDGKKLYNTHRYFRFDVVRQLDSVELEDWEALDDIDAFVDSYLESNTVATEMTLCADSLITPRFLKKSYLPEDPNRDYRESPTQMAAIENGFNHYPHVILDDRVQAYGVGAPQLAYRYAQSQQASSNVFWARADETVNLRQDLGRIAHELNPDATLPLEDRERFKLVQELLNNSSIGRYLLVVAESDKASSSTRSSFNRRDFLQNYLPDADKGRVLIVSATANTDTINHNDANTTTIEIGPTHHIVFTNRDDLPFEVLHVLGHGGFGIVDEVSLKFPIGSLQNTKEVFARKQMHHYKGISNHGLAEIEVLKHINHLHIVRLRLSYEIRSTVSTKSSEFGYLMSPVAETDLSTYLKDPWIRESYGDEAITTTTLLRWIGCLASAFTYLHSMNIRHADIKPSNVLIRRGEVFVADFGTSSRQLVDVSDTKELMTVDHAFSPKYAPPEIKRLNHPRSHSDDMFSLACVYIEMTTVALGRSVGALQDYVSSRSYFVYSENIDSTRRWLDQLHTTLEHDHHHQQLRPQIECVLTWISDMFQSNPHRRISAQQLKSIVSATPGWRVGDKFHCRCLKHLGGFATEIDEDDSSPSEDSDAASDCSSGSFKTARSLFTSGVPELPDFDDFEIR